LTCGKVRPKLRAGQDLGACALCPNIEPPLGLSSTPIIIIIIIIIIIVWLSDDARCRCYERANSTPHALFSGWATCNAGLWLRQYTVFKKIRHPFSFFNILVTEKPVKVKISAFVAERTQSGNVYGQMPRAYNVQVAYERLLQNNLNIRYQINQKLHINLY